MSKRGNIHNRVEPDQTPSVRFQRRGNRIERNLDVHLALSKHDGGADSSSKGTIFGNVDLTELEVSLLFQVELVDIPGAARISNLPTDLPFEGEILTPSSSGDLP